MLLMVSVHLALELNFTCSITDCTNVKVTTCETPHANKQCNLPDCSTQLAVSQSQVAPFTFKESHLACAVIPCSTNQLTRDASCFLTATSYSDLLICCTSTLSHVTAECVGHAVVAHRRARVALLTDALHLLV